MNYNTLITVTSWEDRFIEGVKCFLNNNTVQEAVLFDYEEYISITEKNTDALKKYLNDSKVTIKVIQLKHNDNISNWKIIKNTIGEIDGSVIIDMSTMPRDIIYFLLFHADNSYDITDLYCMYNSPEKYSQDKWLTSDPGKPQLVYNMSGIYEMDKDNVLIIITGFDQKRVEQLLNYYEPKKVYLFLQNGDQYQNNILNAKQYKEAFGAFLHIELLSINAYSEDYGQTELEKLIIKERENSNIIIASLGPKPSAIAVYRLNKKYPDIGIIYVPVARYNETYSSGLSKGQPIFEKIK
jgi:hypothetical protein